MIGRLYHLVAIVSIAGIVATAGLAGYLYFTGRLDAERVEALATVLRGEDVSPADATDAADAGASSDAGPQSERPSAEEVRRQRRAAQLRRAALGRAQRDLEAQRTLLEQAMQNLITRRDAFEQRTQAWLEQQKKLQADTRDAGFERELEYVGKLSPRQAKGHLMQTWKESPADAVRLLNALPTSIGQRILDQMRTPEESQAMHELLERLRFGEVDSFAPASGKTANAVNSGGRNE